LIFDKERIIMMSQPKRLMIGITAGEWEGVHHRPHHMLKRAWKDGWDVLFIESPMTYLSPLKDREKLTQWKNSFKGVKEVDQGLYTLTLPPFYPFGSKERSINKLNQKKINKIVGTFIDGKNYEGIDIYTFLPQTIDLIPLINYDRLIYDCVDDHVSFTGLISKELVLTMEKELMEKANVTFFTARQLQKTKQAWANKSVLVPNGAEYEHFSDVTLLENMKEEKAPADIKPYVKEGKTIVGFTGGIGDWVDLDIVYQAAKQQEDIVYLFIGPIDTKVDESILTQDNIIFLGSKPYADLPRYLPFFDICIIPFKINELTKSVNPIKLYEYLSTGIPVISTSIPEVVTYDSVVSIVEDAETLLKEINNLLTLDEATKTKMKAKRQEIGKENSWDARWNMIKTTI